MLVPDEDFLPDCCFVAEEPIVVVEHPVIVERTVIVEHPVVERVIERPPGSQQQQQQQHNSQTTLPAQAPGPKPTNSEPMGNMRFSQGNGDMSMDLQGLPALLVGLAAVFMGGGGNNQEAVRAAQQAQHMAEQQAEAARNAEAEEKAKKEEAEEKLKVEKRLRDLGIEPDVDVTEAQVSEARTALGYVAGHINVGVVGSQNEGKSTLVNCLRGVDHADADGGAAKVGETETTTASKAYRDALHPAFVWHDIPGGGTERFTGWRYYETLRLYAYDKIVLVHSRTLTQLDIRILQICKYRNQACVVVRTKADEHVRNCHRTKSHASVDAARADYVEQVRCEASARTAEIAGVRGISTLVTDHIISEMGVAKIVSGKDPVFDPDYGKVIDEEAFLRELGLLP